MRWDPFAAADTAIHLDVPSWVSVLRILRRVVRGYGRVRIDSAPGYAERFDAALLRFAWRWNHVSRTRVRGLVAAFEGRRIVLRTAAERRRFHDDPA